MGFPLMKKQVVCASVLALAVWQVAQCLLQLQNPKFLCFVADLFGVDAGMIVCYQLF